MRAQALLLIDLQNAVFDGSQIPPVHHSGRLLQHASSLLNTARHADLPVIHVQHCAAPGEVLEEGGSGWPIFAPLAPKGNEITIRKRSPSAFEGTELHATLQKLSVRALIVAGIQSELCIAATCREALALEYDVFLAEDCHSTWPDAAQTAEQISAAQNVALNDEGAILHPTEALIARMEGAFWPRRT